MKRLQNFDNDFLQPDLYNQHEDDDAFSVQDDANHCHMTTQRISQQDLNYSFLVDQHNRIQQISDPFERKGIISCSFEVWKKKVLKGCFQSFKPGQMCDVLITHIEDSRKFYVLETKRIDDLKNLEECMANYANVLLDDSENINQLIAYQNKASKYDVVLVKAAWDNRWHRAVFLDRESNRTLCPDEFYGKEKNFETFFLIDYGKIDVVITNANDHNVGVYILPLTPKLVQIGCFALKCSINESLIKNGSAKMAAVIDEQLFEKYFKEMLLDKRIQMRISQWHTIKAESEAIVELFYNENDAQNLLKSLIAETDNNYDFFSDERMFQGLNDNCSEVYLKLNCIHFILKRMIAFESEHQV